MACGLENPIEGEVEVLALLVSGVVGGGWAGEFDDATAGQDVGENAGERMGEAELQTAPI